MLIDKNGHIYGATNIRHQLKGKLFEIGGHIGYTIRPSEREKGYKKFKECYNRKIYATPSDKDELT